MTNIIQGNLVCGNEKYCIVIARFNEFIGSKLLAGAVDELIRHGVKEENIDWPLDDSEVQALLDKVKTIEDMDLRQKALEMGIAVLQRKAQT